MWKLFFDSFQYSANYKPYLHPAIFYYTHLLCVLMCEYLVSQWHLRDVCSKGTPVLSARFLSQLTPPHPAPSYCPLTLWLHSREACLLQHCPAIMLARPSRCPTPGPTRKRTALISETPAPGETQQAQQRVIK